MTASKTCPKRMSKQTAARLCAEMWEWLAENPEENKFDYPKYEMGTVANGCFACEYKFQRGVAKNIETPLCRNLCFLIPFWSRCTNKDSAYQRYRLETNFNIRAKYASQIAAAARKVEKACKAKCKHKGGKQ